MDSAPQFLQSSTADRFYVTNASATRLKPVDRMGMESGCRRDCAKPLCTAASHFERHIVADQEQVNELAALSDRNG
jgi:hypothetical protein